MECLDFVSFYKHTWHFFRLGIERNIGMSQLLLCYYKTRLFMGRHMSIHLKYRDYERPKYRYQVQLGETMNCIGVLTAAHLSTSDSS